MFIRAIRRLMPVQPALSTTSLALMLVVLLTSAATPPVTRSFQSPPLSIVHREHPPQSNWTSLPAADLGTLPNGNQWVVRAHFHDRAMVEELAAWREPWEVNYDRSYVVLAVSREDLARLRLSGFRIEIDWALTAQLALSRLARPLEAAGIPGSPCYRTVEETYATAAEIAAQHPNLAEWIDIGDSWEKTHTGGAPGFDIMVLRLTNSAVVAHKPVLFAMGSVHAREYAPAELLTRFAEHLVTRYGSDPDVTWLLDHHEIHLLLQANPDGRKWAESGELWRKNTDNDYCSNSPSRGADLNRNFQFAWGCCNGSSGSECDELYRGPSAASEPETQAIQDYVKSVFPDQREDDLSSTVPVTTTGVFLDIHSYGELVLWPWGFTGAAAPNGPALTTLGRKLAYLNGYTPSQAFELYPSDGTTDDFAYGELGLASYTFEVGTTFFEACGTFEHTIVPDNLDALTYAAKVARRPYLAPAGPDALDLSVTPGATMAGRVIKLTASIDDTRYSARSGAEPTQNIVTAEYYLDVPPWVTGVSSLPNAMRAQDGAFDAAEELVEVTFSTLGLGNGSHTLFVRGQDGAGNWGPFSAVSFEIQAQASALIHLPFITRD